MIRNPCTYHFAWRTCRNRPIITGETEATLRRLLDEISEENGLEVELFEARLDGREVNVRVSTQDLNLSPRSIAYKLRKGTGGYLRRSNPEIQKLPSTWTSEYRVRTFGKGVRND